MTRILQYNMGDDFERLPKVQQQIQQEYLQPYDDSGSRCGFEIEKRDDLLVRIQEACAENDPILVIEHVMQSRVLQPIDWDDLPYYGYLTEGLCWDVLAAVKHVSVDRKTPRTERITHVQRKYFLLHLICKSQQRIAEICRVSEPAVSQSLGIALSRLGVYLQRHLEDKSSNVYRLARVVRNEGWDLVREALYDCLTDAWAHPRKIYSQIRVSHRSKTI